MKLVYLFKNERGIIELTEKRLKELLEEAEIAGYKQGCEDMLTRYNEYRDVCGPNITLPCEPTCTCTCDSIASCHDWKEENNTPSSDNCDNSDSCQLTFDFLNSNDTVVGFKEEITKLQTAIDELKTREDASINTKKPQHKNHSHTKALSNLMFEIQDLIEELGL